MQKPTFQFERAVVIGSSGAAVLAFGLTLRRMGYEAAEASALATPPHRALLGLLARITAGAPEVYWDIQSHNPHAGEVRSAMAASLAELSQIVSDGDIAAFRSRFEDLRLLQEARA